jgi:hypothetical protein
LSSFKPRSSAAAASVPTFGAVALSFVLSAVGFLLLTGVQADKSLHLDATEYVAMAEARLATDDFTYYRGEEWGVAVPHPLHPPLYLYLLTAWFALLGPSAAAARMLGASATLVAGAVTLLLAREIAGAAWARRAAIAFWPLFLLHPYTLQAAAIPDIDTTIYGPVLGALLLAVVRLGRRDGVPRTQAPRPLEWAAVPLLVALALWTKLTTVLLFLVALPFFAPVVWPLARRLRLAAAALGLGGGLFLVTYRLWGEASGHDVFFGVSGLAAVFRERVFDSYALGARRMGDYLEHLRAMVPFTLAWSGLAPFVATGALVAGRAVPAGPDARSLLRRWLLLALAVHFGYCAQTLTFGAAPFKYVASVWPVFVLALAAVLAAAVERCDHAVVRRRLHVLAAAATVLGLAALLLGRFVARDRLVWRLVTTGRIDLPSLAWTSLLAAIALLPFLARPRSRRAALAAAAAIVFASGLGAGTALHQVAAPYATTYNYGQTGLRETASFLTARTGRDELVACMKDLGWFAGRRYLDNLRATSGDEAAELALLAELGSGRVAYAVFTLRFGQDTLLRAPRLREWLRGNARRVARFGDYVVFRPLAAPATDALGDGARPGPPPR